MNPLRDALNYTPKARQVGGRKADSNVLPLIQLRGTVSGPESQSPGRILW